MNAEALLLRGESPDGEMKNAIKMLSFFGLSAREIRLAELLEIIGRTEYSDAKCRMICSSTIFMALIALLQESGKAAQLWRERVHSAFVYGDNSIVFLELARALSRNAQITLLENERSCPGLFVSEKAQEIAGVMSGIRITASSKASSLRLLHDPPGESTCDILSTEDGAVFSKFEYQGVPVLLSTATAIIDIETELPNGTFDIRDYVLEALPVVLYLKWAFRLTSWHPVETSACLIIDDPLLQPTYGFVNFRKLLSHMERHRFSTNIAFIPWNWRRNNQSVVRLFRENPALFSISVHGCDHLRAEFGLTDRAALNRKSRQALHRMAQHESVTGIRHDPVMVFPQGVFSEAAIEVLKCSDFIAAANNDTISFDPSPRPIKVSDVWDVALMVYSDFPVFTRRYPWDGIENFAFDALLGKPILPVIHHDFCSNDCARLITFIERLNALKTRFHWTSLREVASRSCRRRERPGSLPEVEMYATELALENSSEKPSCCIVRRRESDSSRIRSIHVESQPTPWRHSNGYVSFQLELEPRRRTTISVSFESCHQSEPANTAFSEAKTMLRRRLCEVRDNYLMRYTPPFISQRFKVN
jgi:hypothetical protein